MQIQGFAVMVTEKDIKIVPDNVYFRCESKGDSTQTIGITYKNLNNVLDLKVPLSVLSYKTKQKVIARIEYVWIM